MKTLKEKVFTLFKRVGVKGDYESLFQEIVNGYAKPKRFYHSLDWHIKFCFSELEKVRHLVKNYNTVAMALLLHDIILDYHNGQDNEQLSADFAYEFCLHAGLSNEFAREVAELIIKGTKHFAEDKVMTMDEMIVSDIDLAILGQPEEIFSQILTRVRYEVYLLVSEDVFKVKRAGILKLFLERPNIYLTHYFRQRYEATARANLTKEIEMLLEV